MKDFKINLLNEKYIILTMIFFVLKQAGVLNISYWLVFLPVIAAPVISIILFIFAVIIEIVNHKNKKLDI